jgi:regulatory protein
LIRSARQALADLLTRRELSTADAVARLRKRGLDSGVIEAAVAEYVRAGLLDDARFARRYVDFHGSRGDGPYRLRQALQGQGLPEPLIDAALDAVTPAEWAERCEQARRRKFGAARPAALKDKGRQARFLQYRGFSSDHIGSSLGYHVQLDADVPAADLPDPDVDPDVDPDSLDHA